MSNANKFTQGQRWISETEPELGLGTVVQVENGRVQLFYPASGEMRMYAASQAPLNRVRFRVGDSVVTHENRKIVVEEIREEEYLITYIGGGIELPEALLNDAISFNSAEDRLLNGLVDPIADFELRRRTLELRHRALKSPVRGFAGGRIDLIPHQLYIAHEVSSRQAPRVLLSDEVGLGKTIEAGLILHRLLLTGRVARILVIVPDSLVHQWFVEMLRRFNVWLHIFDEERCEAIEEGAPENNPFLDDQLVICSLSFLSASEKRAKQALSAGWDLLIVDEAHHLEWSPDKSSPEYLLIEALSRVAEGVLLLTATPEQLGPESHFARLRLLDPDRYGDFHTFSEDRSHFQKMASLVEKLSAGEKLSKDDLAFVSNRFAHDAAKIDQQLKNIADENETARDSLVMDLLDVHGPGRVIFRNTRAAMSGFPQRRVHLVSLESDKPQKERSNNAITESKSSDNHSVAPAKFDFKHDPRLEWLIGLLKELDPLKVLLICSRKEKVLALEEALRNRVKIKASVFHEDLTLVQRDRHAAWFAELDGARLLICSEIGSEGRNFQFAHHLVLFDLPAHPEVLEQRIGRLDRIGQTEDIDIYVPYVKGSSQEVLARWYHEGLNAFDRSLKGGNAMFHKFSSRIDEIASTLARSPEETEKKLIELIEDSRQEYEGLHQKIAQGRDRLLELNSFRPQIAGQLIEAVQAEDSDPTLKLYMRDVWEHFDVLHDEFAPGGFRLKPQPSTSAVFSSIPKDGISITFDRNTALHREDYSFVTWDHPMVAEAMDLVLGSERGNSSFGLSAEQNEGLYLEAIFVLEAVADSRLHIDRFLPATPIRVDVDHKGTEVVEVPLQVKAGDPSPLLDNPSVTQEIIPMMLQSAGDRATSLAQTAREEALVSLKGKMSREIERLRQLQRVNPAIRPEEIELAEQQMTKLVDAIKAARVRLDAVRVVSVSTG